MKFKILYQKGGSSFIEEKTNIETLKLIPLNKLKKHAIDLI